MWHRVPFCFELLSPMHIGFLPNGSGTVVAPTRFYVPGKNFWGAVTASLTPRLFHHAGPTDFARVGACLRRSVRFSYFYLSAGPKLYVPSFESGNLTWSGISDADFRAIFADSRLATQVSVDGAAEDGGLHEIEYVRHLAGSPQSGSDPVRLCGIFWCDEEAEIVGRRLRALSDTISLQPLRSGDAPLDPLEELAVGGERNYGFGRIKVAQLPHDLRRTLEELWPADPDLGGALDRPLLGHAAYDPAVPFTGDLEVMASREYPPQTQRSYAMPGAAIINSGYCFAPGTCLHGQYRASVDEFGRLKLTA